MGGVVRRDDASVYHVLPAAREADGACCWHCCEMIAPGEPVVPLPRVHADGVYHVFGRTCSPACAKAYVLEHTTFDRGAQLDVLVKMLREVYGVTGPVHETPPRPALRRFGGHFDPRATPRAACRLVTPPFVSYCMLVAETTQGDDMVPEALPAAPEEPEEADTFDAPQPPGVFEAFVQARKAGSAVAVAPPAAAASSTGPSKRRRGGDGVSAGPMSRFVKSK